MTNTDGIMLVLGEDGVARQYDDTYDITIHCESEEEQKKVLELISSVSNREPFSNWTPVSKDLPKEDKEYLVTKKLFGNTYILDIVSFAKNLHKVNQYSFPEQKTGWFDYDSEWGYHEVFDVVAWTTLPKPWEITEM